MMNGWRTRLQLHEIVEAELGEVPEDFQFKVEKAESVEDAILQECQQGNYDLLIIGAVQEVLVPEQILGKLNDYLIDVVPCSMMVVRRFQTDTSLWMRKQLKRIE